MYVTATGMIPEVARWRFGNLGQLATAPALGTFARVEFEVNLIVSGTGSAAAQRRLRWSRAGSLLLDPQLVNNDVKIFYPGPGQGPQHPCTAGPPAGSQNRFRRGHFQNQFKCNVFALDIAWRSGFRVPLSNIHTSANPCYSYPLANTLTAYAERAFVNGNTNLTGTNGTQWGWTDTYFGADLINDWIAQGSLELLVGSRRSGTGHVGIISHVRSIVTDATNHITDITYDGWEATGRSGATPVTNKRWRTTDFNIIHIIGLVSEVIEANRSVVTA